MSVRSNLALDSDARGRNLGGHQLITFAYCCESFAEVTRQGAGVEPVTAPPMLDDRFEPQWLEGHALLWFDLHGMPGVPWWQGDRGVIALTAQTVRRADLDGALVFALSCYLGERNSPMLEALLDAGARYVVGGAGQNWSNLTRPTGAGLLGLRFRQFLDRGADPLRALALAKRWLQLKMAFNRLAGAKAGKMLADKDALAFRAYYRGTV